MTTQEKTLLAVLTVAAALVPLALSAAFDWPTWSWLFLTALLLVVLALVARNIQQRAQQEQRWQSYVAPPGQVEQQDQAQRTLGPDIALTSAVAGYRFRFSATAYWRPARRSKTEHANLGALAAKAILARAQTITAVEQPDKVDVVAYQLASALGVVQRDESGAVEAWADHVQLTLSEADQERLCKHSDLRKDDDLGEHERNHERRKCDYLREEVMKSTGSAVIWWLVQKNNDVEDTVRLIGSLAQLWAAANDSEVPELFRHLVPTAVVPAQLPYSDISPVASHCGALMDTLSLPTDEQRALFARCVAQLSEKLGKPDEAQEIRRHFDAPVIDKESAALPAPDGDPPDRAAPDVELLPRQEPWRNSPLSMEPEPDGQLPADERLRPDQLDEPRD